MWACLLLCSLGLMAVAQVYGAVQLWLRGSQASKGSQGTAYKTCCREKTHLYRCTKAFFAGRP